jgi:hypothetical protein
VLWEQATVAAVYLPQGVSVECSKQLGCNKGSLTDCLADSPLLKAVKGTREGSNNCELGSQIALVPNILAYLNEKINIKRSA